MAKSWFLYMLLWDQKIFYVGITDDMPERFSEHKNKQILFTSKFSDFLQLKHVYNNDILFSMNNAFVKHTLAAGKKGEEWLQQLPEIIEKYEGKWSFQALNPFDLSYNYVAPAKQKNGTKTVLPIGIP